MEQCHLCPLNQHPYNPGLAVPGFGYIDAKLMIIGEAPGYWESKKGYPFVGKSGMVLQDILQEIDADASELFVANVIKHRPPNNRDPSWMELHQCWDYLEAQIELVDPKLIICVGKVPAKTLANKAQVELPEWGLRSRRFKYDRWEVRITWHPAYVMGGRTPQKRPELVQDLRMALADARDM